MVKHNSQIFQSMSLTDLIKLIPGLRCLLGKIIVFNFKKNLFKSLTEHQNVSRELFDLTQTQTIQFT